MVKKKISFDKRKDSVDTIKSDADELLDNWVMGNEKNINKETKVAEKPLPTENEGTYRFTMVMPTYLHRRIKKTCAVEGVSMKEKIIDIFEKYFPET